MVASAVAYRTARIARFGTAAGLAAWRETRANFRASSVAVAVLGAIPIIVAVVR